MRHILRAIAADLSEASDELNRLDAIAGDGDLGVTAAAAAEAIRAIVADASTDDPAALLQACGVSIARVAPSTAGTLAAMALLRAAAAIGGASPDSSALSRMSLALDAGTTAISERGRAKPGQRTLLDALWPAADALRTAAIRGSDLKAAVEAAAIAAAAGAERTASMTPQAGRARWTGKRSAGTVDAGAAVVALVFRSASVDLERRGAISIGPDGSA